MAIKPTDKPTVVEKILKGADSVLTFLSSLTDIERLLKAFRGGVGEFTRILKAKDEPKKEE